MNRRIPRCGACGDLAHGGSRCGPHTRDLSALDAAEALLAGPPVVTRERAQALWDAKGPMGEWPAGSYTPEEDAYIKAVWYTLPGDTCWADAVLVLAMGGS